MTYTKVQLQLKSCVVAIVLILTTVPNVMAQVKGVIRDANTNEEIIGASIHVSEEKIGDLSGGKQVFYLPGLFC